MKLLHLADCHIGAAYSSLNPLARKMLKTAMFNTLVTLPQVMHDQDLDGLIIAGDFYDTFPLQAQWHFAVVNTFKKILDQGKLLVYASGNHDHGIGLEDFKSLSTYKNFVTFFDDRPRSTHLTFKGHDLTLHGVGYSQAQPQTSPMAGFKPAMGKGIHIGLAHGVIQGHVPQGKTPYYGIGLEAIKALNYDYFALGHLHDTWHVGPRVAYPGSLVPIAYTDKQFGYGLVVTLDQGHSQVDPIKLYPLDFTHLKLKVSANTSQTLIEEVVTGLGQGIDMIRDKILIIKVENNQAYPLGSHEKDVIFEALFGTDKVPHQLVYTCCQAPSRQGISLPKEVVQAIDRVVDQAIEDLSVDKLGCLLPQNQVLDKLKANPHHYKRAMMDYLMGGGYES